MLFYIMLCSFKDKGPILFSIMCFFGCNERLVIIVFIINLLYEAWPGKSCTLLIFSLFDALSSLNFSNTFRNSNSVKRGA